MEREADFSKDIEFKISFKRYIASQEYEDDYPEDAKWMSKEKALLYERIYGRNIFELRNIIFPLTEGFWTVRLIGDQRIATKASGFLPLLDSSDSRIEAIPSETPGEALQGYTRIQPLTSSDEEMVNIRCDRNTNDEFVWRGTGGEFQEFIDEKLRPSLN